MAIAEAHAACDLPMVMAGYLCLTRTRWIGRTLDVTQVGRTQSL